MPTSKRLTVIASSSRHFCPVVRRRRRKGSVFIACKSKTFMTLQLSHGSMRIPRVKRSSAALALSVSGGTIKKYGRVDGWGEMRASCFRKHDRSIASIAIGRGWPRSAAAGRGRRSLVQELMNNYQRGMTRAWFTAKDAFSLWVGHRSVAQLVFRSRARCAMLREKCTRLMTRCTSAAPAHGSLYYAESESEQMDGGAAPAATRCSATRPQRWKVVDVADLSCNNCDLYQHPTTAVYMKKWSFYQRSLAARIFIKVDVPH